MLLIQINPTLSHNKPTQHPAESRRTCWVQRVSVWLECGVDAFVCANRHSSVFSLFDVRWDETDGGEDVHVHFRIQRVVVPDAYNTKQTEKGEGERERAASAVKARYCRVAGSLPCRATGSGDLSF